MGNGTDFLEAVRAEIAQRIRDEAIHVAYDVNGVVESVQATPELIADEVMAVLTNRLTQLYRLRAVGRALLALKDGPRDATYQTAKPLMWHELRVALDKAGGDTDA